MGKPMTIELIYMEKEKSWLLETGYRRKKVQQLSVRD